MVSLRKVPQFLKRHAFAAICAFLTIAVVVTYFMRMDLLPQTRTDAELRQSEAENIKRNLRNANQLKEHLAAMNELLATVDSRLVRADDLAGNLQYFYRLESETGVKILLLRPMQGAGAGSTAPGAKTGPYLPVPYSVIVEGAFAQVMAFLTELERGVHFNRTQVFTAQRGATDSPDGVRSGTVVVNLSVELLAHP